MKVVSCVPLVYVAVLPQRTKDWSSLVASYTPFAIATLGQQMSVTWALFAGLPEPSVLV